MADINQARKAAHKDFDQLWDKKLNKDAKMTRTSAYKWLQLIMEKSEDDSHFSKFSEAECKRAVRQLRKYNAEALKPVALIKPREIDFDEVPHLVYIDKDVEKQRRNNQSNSVYHSEQEHISSSGLKEILRSPLHYKYKKDNPEPPTKNMIQGSAFHTALLEPDNFDKEYMCMPDFNLKFKADREELAELVRANPKKMILDKEKYDKILGAKHAVLQNNTVLDLLSTGKPEVSFYTSIWTHLGFENEWYPIKVKVRPDFLHDDYTFVSLKTAQDASPDGYARACAMFKYDLSEALYLDVMSQFAKRQLFRLYVIVVEITEPFAHSVYEIKYPTDEFIVEGRAKYRKALKKLLYCKLSGLWHGYEIDSHNDRGTLDLKLPNWGYDNLLFDKTIKQF